MKKKSYIILAMATILTIIIVGELFYLTMKNEYMIVNPSQSSMLKEDIYLDEMPSKNLYSIKFISKNNGKYKVYYVYDGCIETKQLDSTTNVGDNFNKIFKENKTNRLKTFLCISILGVTIEIILLVYILHCKDEEINSRLKSIIFCIATFLLNLIAFVYIPMVSKNHIQLGYVLLILLILYITSLLWGYKRKSIFRFELLILIPFVIGILFNYSNVYLGNTHIDINKILFISEISNTISFFMTIFAYFFVGICGGITGRLYKDNRLSKLHIIGCVLFGCALTILIFVRIFSNSTLSILASSALSLVSPAIILSLMLISAKYVYQKLCKQKLKN